MRRELSWPAARGRRRADLRFGGRGRRRRLLSARRARPSLQLRPPCQRRSVRSRRGHRVPRRRSRPVAAHRRARPDLVGAGAAEGVSAGAVRSVDWTGVGEVLLTCGRSVLVLGGDGSSWHALTRLVWSYTDPDLIAPCWARRIGVGSSSYVLIADPGAHRVFAVSYETKELVWQYGVTGDPGVSPGHLLEPVCAEYVAAGTGGAPTVLIADAAAQAPRVVEVSWAANLVTAAARAAGSSGSCPPTRRRADWRDPCRCSGSPVASPSSPTRQHRVFAVDLGGALRWQYGVVGRASWRRATPLRPAGAARLSNDRTLIVDGGNRRTIAYAPSVYRIDGDLHGWTGRPSRGRTRRRRQPRRPERRADHQRPGARCERHASGGRRRGVAL